MFVRHHVFCVPRLVPLVRKRLVRVILDLENHLSLVGLLPLCPSVLLLATIKKIDLEAFFRGMDASNGPVVVEPDLLAPLRGPFGVSDHVLPHYGFIHDGIFSDATLNIELPAVSLDQRCVLVPAL